MHRVRVVLGPGVFGLEFTAPRERGRESRVWARYGGARDHCLALSEKREREEERRMTRERGGIERRKRGERHHD